MSNRRIVFRYVGKMSGLKKALEEAIEREKEYKEYLASTHDPRD